MQDKKTAMNGVRLFVLDMDGTVYLGDDPIGGALDFVREVDSSSDRDYLFFTNNASKVPSVYVEKLGKMGLEITEDKVVTAGDVCAAASPSSRHIWISTARPRTDSCPTAARCAA